MQANLTESEPEVPAEKELFHAGTQTDPSPELADFSHSFAPVTADFCC
jgi:hypothetical protein